MNRIEQLCPGDCAKCQLLADGKVDMVPCALDQIMRRILRMEKNIDNLQAAQPAATTLASLELNE